MIGKLTGRLDYRAADHALIDVAGVGYTVYCSERTLAALPETGATVALYTELLVREDILQLFGFQSVYEREWHRLLLSVQGIGAKASMAILGTLGADGVARAITLGDWAAIKAAPGVGPKIAQRVVNELKDKAPAAMAIGGSARPASLAPAVPGDTARPEFTAAPDSTTQADAMSALSNLGYAPSEAARAVAAAQEAVPEAETAALIRAALRLLAPKE